MFRPTQPLERRAQSIVEYAILLCVVLAALLIMQFYIKRGYQGKIKQQVDELGQQYSPGHTTSTSTSTMTTSSETYTGGNISIGGEKVEIEPGMTVTKSSTTSGFSKEEKVDSFATEE